MAIYHFTAKIVDRESGRSIVGAAAYRAGERLKEHRTNTVWDFRYKRGVEHREILAPQGAPAWVFDRPQLWNNVDQIERRKDAQLARDIEIALPVELDATAQVALLRDFVQRHFVAAGMIADGAIHRDNPNNPHAHVLLSMRNITPKGFGLKERAWNTRSSLQAWRVGWAEVANEHLAKAGLSVRIDHRTLKAQGLDLIPGRKIGVGLERQQSPQLPYRIAERVAEQRAIAAENGFQIITDPNVAIKALTHYQATFTEHDIAKFINTRTDGADPFREAYLRVTTSPELVLLGTDDRGRKRYTSREMLEVESAMLYRAELMTLRSGHGVAKHPSAYASLQGDLSGEQRVALKYLLEPGDLKSLVGVAGSGKSRLLSVARQAWEAQGYTVKGAALAGIAAEHLTLASGINARTLARYELAWEGDRDPLTSNDVLVIDEAALVGTRQLARVLEAAEKAKAKVVMVGDPEPLQSIEAGTPFTDVIAESGFVELNEVQRQILDWHRKATRQLAQGETADALAAYDSAGAIIQTPTRDRAKAELIKQWSADARTKPDPSRLILAYTRKDVRELNEMARSVRRARRELGHPQTIETERGMREFAVHDRLYFLRTERSLGVKNRTLGTLTSITDGVLEVRLDGTNEQVTVDTRFYRDLDHGYAATVYTAQGATVDRSYLLATSHYDRHAAYVALSRHRQSAMTFYAAEDFGATAPVGEGRIDVRARQQFVDVLSQARPKELAHGYLDRDDRFRSNQPPHFDPREASGPPKATTPSQPDRPILRRSMDEIDATQQRAAERWRDQYGARQAEPTPPTDLDPEKHLDRDHPSPPARRALQKRRELEHPGPEDDLEL